MFVGGNNQPVVLEVDLICIFVLFFVSRYGVPLWRTAQPFFASDIFPFRGFQQVQCRCFRIAHRSETKSLSKACEPFILIILLIINYVFELGLMQCLGLHVSVMV